MKDIVFDPKELTLSANVDNVVAMTNVGTIQHDFAIDALAVKVTLDPGQAGSATINAPAGAYEYYCSIPGHKAAGMVGTLTVT